jgi:hypothetical protein
VVFLLISICGCRNNFLILDFRIKHEMGRAFDGPVRLAHDEKGLQSEKGDSAEAGSPFCLQANGFNCRHQIEHATGRQAQHAIQILAEAIRSA